MTVSQAKSTVATVRARARALASLSALAMIVTLLVGSAGTLAEAAAPKPTKLTLAATTKLLAVGQTYTAKIEKVTPTRASKKVTWTSSNRRIATVAASGKINALKAGKVTIRATSKATDKVTAKLSLTVSLKPTKITLTSTTETVAVGQKFTARVKTIAPAKASKKVSWTSSDKNVATVTSKGVVQAVGAGTATITAKSVLSSKVKQTIKVTVNATATTPPPKPNPPKPAPVIDPKLLGSWSMVSSSGGVFTTYNADGTWLRVVIIRTSFSEYQNTSKGNYRAEGGKIYSSDTIFQSRNSDSGPWSEWRPAAEPNRVENYAIGTDEYGEYLVSEDDPNPVTEESVKYRRD